MSLLEVLQLRKCFGELVAVDDVSFRVEAGEVFGLLGPNGAGKSTTMMMLAGLIEPDSGVIKLDGVPLETHSRKLRTALGVVPQELAIYPDMTARENLMFFGRLYDVPRAELKKRIDAALERVGLTGRADDMTGAYSGGMKRRLNFAIALLHRPRLLILDEPTVGVDPQSRSHLLDCVRDLSGEGVATLYASHYMEEVQSICQRVAIIDHGRMIACDGLSELLGRLSADLCLKVTQVNDELREKLNGLAELQPSSNGVATIVVSRDQHEDEARLVGTLRSILSLLESTNVHLQSVETHDPNLERLFLQLTGNRLRD